MANAQHSFFAYNKLVFSLLTYLYIVILNFYLDIKSTVNNPESVTYRLFFNTAVKHTGKRFREKLAVCRVIDFLGVG
jgi:hypothetical protein